jgi:hypothetical protein
MASFERVLMPGLDKDQYSILWVEHADKGRLELNFLIPNTELLTGKRLQPYYDRADRPRIDAWQTVVNGRLGLHDPNAPENGGRWSRRPDCRKRSRKPQRLSPGTACPCLVRGAENRQDVTEALETAGFEVVRTTKAVSALPTRTGGETSD